MAKTTHAEKRIAEVLSLDMDLELTRDDLLSLARLSKNFVLREWPVFPSPDEVMGKIRWAFFQHTSQLTDSWYEIKQDINMYPPLIQEVILKSFAHHTRKIGPSANSFFGIGFDVSAYTSNIRAYKALYDRASEILSRPTPAASDTAKPCA